MEAVVTGFTVWHVLGAFAGGIVLTLWLLWQDTLQKRITMLENVVYYKPQQDDGSGDGG